MQTPNLEKLARQGVILNQHYVLPTCTPTRAALLTGRYPYKMGMQVRTTHLLRKCMNELCMVKVSVRLEGRTLLFKGNDTFFVARWHLGYCNLSLTPTRRGFDTFRGYYLGSQDYFSHTASGGKNSPEAAGYDYWKNESVDYSAQGHYSTYLIADHVIETIEDKSKKNGSLFLYVAFQAAHAPTQVPRGYQANCSSHANKKRVRLCEMTDAMDHAVGRIVRKLKDAHMWNNCLLVFMSDNGGQVRYGGNNWPLRGNKNTLYEGGTRVPAFVSGPLLKRPNTTSSRRV
ncbi:hypothetical protein HPB50_021048 [Hyalomma asiaticum]|uniref:Uncharacterized protein n=1 Tax=Hyalomma asiaticum TaxID=266040 RepID=A0ACB7RZ23_HYAAI|nr:hypothetical protein HPB50_021048 [Hyalomma asiaticum]